MVGICTQMNWASISMQTPAQYPAAPICTNEAAFGWGGGQGSLLSPCAGQTPAAQPTLTPQQITALWGHLNILPHHLNTEGGHASYHLQLVEWERMHGWDAKVTEETPYLLWPGMAPVCAGECWIYGMVGHQRGWCQVQPGNLTCISQWENLWHCICGTMLGPINWENATPVQHVAVDQYGYTLDSRIGTQGGYWSGKRGRVIGLRDEQMTPMDSLKEQLVLMWKVVAHEDNPFIPAEQSQSACISHELTEYEIVDLYSVGHEQRKKDTIPFIHMLSLEGPKGEAACIWGLSDDGALVNVICSTIFDKVKKCLGPGATSKRQLQMANGSIIPSKMYWEGYVNLRGIGAKITFKVFNSGGNWAFLFGKPSLETFNTIHDYRNDTVFIAGIGSSTTIPNQEQYPHYAHIAKVAGVNLALDIKQYKPEWITCEANTMETMNKTTNRTDVANLANGGRERQCKLKSVKWVQ